MGTEIFVSATATFVLDSVGVESGHGVNDLIQLVQRATISYVRKFQIPAEIFHQQVAWNELVKSENLLNEQNEPAPERSSLMR